jgi:hypothetical protein
MVLFVIPSYLILSRDKLQNNKVKTWMGLGLIKYPVSHPGLERRNNFLRISEINN